MSTVRERRARRAKQAQTSRRWRPALLVLLAAAAIIALAMIADGPTGNQGSAKTKKAGKRPETPAPQRKPRLRLAGRVQEAAGRPVKGATVFVLPKTRRGGVRDDLVHEVTDGEGRWSLQARSAYGCWIGVVAKGYMHAYLDGDKVDPSVQMFHILEPAPALEVKLLDPAGAPIAGKGVQLEPWPPATTWFLPRPGGRQGEQWAVSDADGGLSFRVGSRGPVLLVPHVEGHHTVPPRTWLAQASGETALRLRPNASVDLHVAAAGSGAPFGDLLTVDFHEAATGRLTFSFTESPDANGVLAIDRRIRPGTYDVHVQAEGWCGVVKPDVVLSAGADARASVPVELAAAAACSTLTLRLRSKTVAPRRPARPGARRRTPLTFVRRKGAGWHRLGWSPGAPESWDPTTKTLVLELVPGRYDVLVADVVLGCTTLLEDLELSAAGRIQKTLTLQPGLGAPTTSLRLGDGHARTVRVQTPQGVALPVYGHTRNRAVRIGSERDLLARAGERRKVDLGPYPVGTIHVEVKTWEGAVRKAEHTK